MKIHFIYLQEAYMKEHITNKVNELWKHKKEKAESFLFVFTKM